MRDYCAKSDENPEIKSHIVLSSVVKKAVQLKGNGPKYLGLCPFHEEKTPSFNVNDKLGRFKCFGCGASGDVFEFIMRLRGLSFKEALQDAAYNAGLKIGPDLAKAKRSITSDDSARELLRAQKIAHEYFIKEIKRDQRKSGAGLSSLAKSQIGL